LLNPGSAVDQSLRSAKTNNLKIHFRPLEKKLIGLGPAFVYSTQLSIFYSRNLIARLSFLQQKWFIVFKMLPNRWRGWRHSYGNKSACM